jgi:hypothetical protein
VGLVTLDVDHVARFLFCNSVEDHIEHFVEHADFASCHGLTALKWSVWALFEGFAGQGRCESCSGY